jgi:transcription attenuation protein (tryptophan RNA-binding attenuator protein)
MDTAENNNSQEYIIVKALKDGVNIIGMTRGRDTKFHHTEKLDKGEVMIAQFTENTSAIKIRGSAQILTAHGLVISGEE